MTESASAAEGGALIDGVDAAVEVATVVVAAGSGTRLAAGAPKAFVPLGGVTLLERTLRGLLAARESMRVVVVAPEALLDEATAIAARAGLRADEVAVVAGGATRQASVAAGLAAIGDGPRIVLVHDAARPLTPAEQIDRVVAAVREHGCGVIPVLPVSDTIKRVDGDLVLETVDRSQLAAVQTPQGFPRAVLEAAYRAAEQEHTDDAALVQASGTPVRTIVGDRLADKITTPWDLRRAELALGGSSARTGIGVDVHAYDPDSPMHLAGLEWPGEAGLKGHSDGDAVIHAICDALLSAGGLGDLGSRFGTSDPRFAGARSEVFLAETLRLVAEAGYRVGNVAVQVAGPRPRLAPRRAEAEARLTALVGAPVSLAGTTTDGLGFPGRGEGLAALASALLLPA